MSITGLVSNNHLKMSADTKRILELRKKGVSYRVIAIAVDLSHETVRKVCKQYLE